MSGIEGLPMLVPGDWPAFRVWFEQVFVREYLAKLDTRNATGSGIAVTSDGNSTATLTIPALAASLITVNPETDVPNSRQLVVEADLTEVDAGIQSTLTLGLADKGIAGTYTKVTTDAKGQVTAGTTLDASDIPSLDASKIGSGTFADGRISESSVTQHQAALQIAFSQITSNPITTGTGAPTTSPPDGILYVRQDGGDSTSLYMRIGGAWKVATFA